MNLDPPEAVLRRGGEFRVPNDGRSLLDVAPLLVELPEGGREPLLVAGLPFDVIPEASRTDSLADDSEFGPQGVDVVFDAVFARELVHRALAGGTGTRQFVQVV